MKKKYLLLGLVLLLTAALVQSAAAQMGPKGKGGPCMGGPGMEPGGPPMGPFWKVPEMVEKLKLTEDQIAALEKIDMDFQDRQITARAEMEKAHLVLERAFGEKTIDEKAVMNQAKILADAQNRMFLLHVEQRAKVRKVLTADQWSKLDALRPPHPGMGEGRPHHGRGPESGPPQD